MKRYPSISPVYNRLNYRSKSGFAPVYLRIYYRGKTDYVLLDRVPSIHKRDWVGDIQQDIYVLNPEINKLIREILFATRDWVQSKVLQGHSISVKEIKEHLQTAKTNETFNEFVDRFIRNVNKRKSEAEKLSFRTIQTYRSFEVRLNEFRSNIRFDEVTPSMAHEFERYLAVDCNLRGVTRAKHFDKFKIVYRAALKEGLVKLDDKLMFDDIKIKEEKSRRVSLTQTEFRTFLETELDDPKDEFFKSVFLFQCLTGSYYSDVLQMKVSYIKKETFKEGDVVKTVDYISGQRFKNDQEYTIPLFDITKRILEKHSNWPISKNPDDPLFKGLISEQKYNQKLKKIAAQLKVNKNLSNKVGRHSFSEMMASMGVPLKTLGHALGHTQVSTTEIYARMSKANALRGWIDFEL